MASGLAVQQVTIHGHHRAYVKAGSGPALLLLHGLGCDLHTWDPVIRELAERFTVVAPDLLGHGESDKPRADYSIGGYANGMRDLLTVLGIDRATVVGHSFGGGVAMQFAYQFPERTERVLLVAPGGLGPEVNPAVRAVTLPGFQQAMAVATLPGVRHVGTTLMRLLALTKSPALRDLDEVAAIYDSFRDPAARAAISHVVRACIDWKGQVITMADRAYLTRAVPMCVIWGEEDAVIPAEHAEIARVLLPDADIELVPDSGHFPHKDHPERFIKILTDFVDTTESARHDHDEWRDLLSHGPAAPRVRERAGAFPRTPVLRRIGNV